MGIAVGIVEFAEVNIPSQGPQNLDSFIRTEVESVSERHLKRSRRQLTLS